MRNLSFVIMAAVTSKKLRHYVEYYLDPELDAQIRAWIEERGWKDVRLEPRLHVTMLYGFGDEHRGIVEDAVRKIQLPSKITLGNIRFGRIHPLVLLEVNAPDLAHAFWQLHPQIKDCPHVLIDGQYVAHVTLGWFDPARDRTEIDLTDHGLFAGQTSTLNDFKIVYK